MKNIKYITHLKLILVFLVLISNTATSQTINILYQDALRNYINGNPNKSISLMDSILNVPKIKSDNSNRFFLSKNQKNGLNYEFRRLKSKEKYEYYLLAANSSILTKKTDTFEKYRFLALRQSPLTLSKSIDDLLPELRDYVHKHISLPRITFGLSGGNKTFYNQIIKEYPTEKGNKIDHQFSYGININYWYLKNFGVGTELSSTSFQNVSLNQLNTFSYLSMRNTLNAKLRLNSKLGVLFEKQSYNEYENIIYPKSVLNTELYPVSVDYSKNDDVVIQAEFGIDYLLTDYIILNVSLRLGKSIFYNQISDDEWINMIDFGLAYAQLHHENFSYVAYANPSYLAFNVGVQFAIFDKIYSKK